MIGHAMRRLVRRLTFLGGISAVVIPFGGFTAFAADPVVIGAIYPTKTAIGQQAMRGGQIALDMINAAGGVLNRPLKVVTYDTNFSPAEGASAVQRLIEQDKAKVVVGEIGSTVALAVIPIVLGEKAIFMAAIPKHPDVTKKGQPGIFRANSTSEMDDAAFDEILLKQVKPTKVGLIGENSDYGQLEVAHWKKLFGDKVVYSTLFGMQQSDFSSLVANLRASGADLVCIMSSIAEQYGNILANMNQIGFHPKLCLAAGTLTADGVKVAGKGAEGALSSDIYLASVPGEFNKKFVEAFRAKYQYDPGKVEALGFEVVWIVAQAMKQANTVEDTARISAAIQSGKWEVPRGTVTFDDRGQARGTAAFPVVVKDGRIITVP